MADTQWKDLWLHSPLPGPENEAGLKPMLQPLTRAVFKKVRAQLLWEACLFSAILFTYYDIFDGYRKPLYANIILVAAGVGILTHSMLGYRRFRPAREADDLRGALKTQLKRLRRYAFYSVVTRGAWTLALAVFFGAALTVHGWAFPAGLGLLLLGQVLWLSHIWKTRIRILQEAVAQLSAGELPPDEAS